jgi:DNA polymerase-3 subunit delta'
VHSCLPYFVVAIIDLFGHEKLRERLLTSVTSGSLPSSLLFQGPRGVGKQRLAIWIAQRLLCREEINGAGECVSCRYVANLTHPDLHWIFPRPRLRDSDPDLDQVRDDYNEAIRDRVEQHGLYAAPSGSEGIYVAAVRYLVQMAVKTPAMGHRKVFIIGDAERMVPQEGSDMAANAFLKLLEEPPADTTLILTSSEPGALLPTVRSRVATVRVPLVHDKAVRAFVENPIVKQVLDKETKATTSERVRAASGAPGTLFNARTTGKATLNARRIIDAATAPRASGMHAIALSQGSTGARGAFSDTLDALVALLGERTRDALHRNDDATAAATTKAIDAVLKAQTYTETNVSPQLIASRLVRELSAALR